MSSGRADRTENADGHLAHTPPSLVGPLYYENQAMSKPFPISIVSTLRDRGHQGYLVGGCVRDLLLGREPADYDVATDATPDEVMRIFPETYAVGAQFGVVLVPLPDEFRPVILSEDAGA